MSPTRRVLTAGEVAGYAVAAFGVGVDECGPMAGGGFAAVWRVSLGDGRVVVLKAGAAGRDRPAVL